MIQLENICKSYGSLEVLRDVTLRIRPMSYTAFVGPSGSGKSTLMHILGCLDTPTSGRYFLDGEEVGSLSGDALCRVRLHKIGFIFQGYQLMSKLSAVENVAFPLLLRGIAEEERIRSAHEALKRVGMDHRAHHRPCELSGGQQQRVAVARALCAKPRILLCDEPTGALDTQSRNTLLDLLDQLHQDGHTIVMITHDPFVASRAAQRCRVENGQVISLSPGAYSC